MSNDTVGSSRQPQRQRFRRWAMACLFLLAFLPRAVYPVSRPLQWYFRSGNFVQATLHGDWTGTLLSEHPGVTVMWLSGAALWGWYGLQSLVGLNAPNPLETEGYAFANRVAVGVLPLALIIALGIIWGYYLLRRLFGEKVAWVSVLLWALDPFFLANSKVLHLDATLSTLMLLSALWMLVYVQEKGWSPSRRRALTTSAVLGGLAVLTKVTALFLLPFLGLCLLADWLSSTRDPDGTKHLLPSTIGDFGLWLLIATAICFALWPSLWVQPRASLDLIFRQGILLHTGAPRDQPIYYRATLGVQDPGPRFYLDVLLYRTTFLTLPLSWVGVLSACHKGVQRREWKDPRTFWLLLSFAVFYFVQMSLGGWKDSRYMLPVLLILDVLAAQGVVWLLDRVVGTTRGRAAITVGLIGTQALTVLLRHPYYGTHYNELLGGAKAAAEVFSLAEFGEGLDLAGQYIDDHANGAETAVGTQFLANEMVAQHVHAPVYDISQIGEEADYLAFGVQYTMRGADYPRWGKLWEQTYKFRKPAFVAKLGDLPYAWVHRPAAEPAVPQRVNARLGDTLHLLGYRLAQPQLAPGETLLLTLFWRAEAPVDEAYTVFSHVQGPGGSLIAQQDNPPRRGAHPTDNWTPGALIEDPYELDIPSNIAPGEYTINTGMYDPTTMERLPAFDAEGKPISNNSVVLTSVRVRPRVPSWRWALSTVWLTIVAAGAVCACLPSGVKGNR